MANVANPQLAQSREATKRLQDEINTFRAENGRNFTNLREVLFDDNNRQFGAVGDRIETTQRQCANLNTRLEEMQEDLTALQTQLRHTNERANDHLTTTINQSITPINNRLTNSAQTEAEIQIQLGRMEERFTNLATQAQLVTSTGLAPIQTRLDTMAQQITTINDRQTSARSRTDFQTLLAPLGQRFDGMDQRLSAIEPVVVGLDHRFTSLRQEVEAALGRRDDELRTQIDVFRADLREGRSPRRRKPKVVKVFCVVL